MKKIELNPPRGGSSQPADFLRPHSPHRRVLFIVQPRKAAGRKRIFRFGVQKWAKNWQQRVVLWAFQGNLWVKKSTFCIVGNFLGIPQFWFFFFGTWFDVQTAQAQRIFKAQGYVTWVFGRVSPNANGSSPRRLLRRERAERLEKFGPAGTNLLADPPHMGPASRLSWGPRPIRGPTGVGVLS